MDPAAHDFVRSIIGVDVWLVNVTPGKLGRRVVASFLLADGRNLATGRARLYWDVRCPKWC